MIENTKSKKRETLIFRIQWWHDLEKLPSEIRLEMLSHIMQYVEYGTEPELDGFEALFFDNVRRSIDKAMSNYDARVEADLKRRSITKVRKLQCVACKKSTECKNKENFKKTGKCKEAKVDNEVKAKISLCSACSMLCSCKNKAKYVKNKEIKNECSKFLKSSNIYYYYRYDDSIDNTNLSSTNVSERSISIPSSPSKEKRKVSNFSGDVGGGDSSLYDKTDVLDRLESRGVERQWADSNYDDLEAIGFKTGRNPITNLVSFMVAKWEKFRESQKNKELEVAEKEQKEMAEQDALDKKLGRGAYAVPKEYIEIVSCIKDRIKKSDSKGAPFMDAFTLTSVTDSEIVISAPSESAFVVYEQLSGNEFEKELLDAIPGRKISHIVVQ